MMYLYRAGMKVSEFLEIAPRRRTGGHEVIVENGQKKEPYDDDGEHGNP